MQDKVEQQHLKRLVLDYEQREEAEEWKGAWRNLGLERLSFRCIAGLTRPSFMQRWNSAAAWEEASRFATSGDPCCVPTTLRPEEKDPHPKRIPWLSRFGCATAPLHVLRAMERRL